jgi:hypothetical protein
MAILKRYACRPCLFPCVSPVTLHSLHTKLGSADKDQKCTTDKRFGLLAVGQTVGPLTVPFFPRCFQVYFGAGCVMILLRTCFMMFSGIIYNLTRLISGGTAEN